MGEDKSLLPFAGFNTLAEFQHFRLSKIFSTVYISCKDKAKFDFEALYIEDVKLKHTKEIIFAPTAGFVAVYNKLKVNSFFVLSVDAPFVSKKEIQKIIDSDTTDFDAIIAKTAFGIQPMCGIYHHSLKNNFTQMLHNNNHKLGFLLKSSNTLFINFNDEKPFLNLNHPYEYEEALTLI